MAKSLEELGAPAAPRMGRVRWIVVWLLFAATAINYVDRQMIAVLKPDLANELHWTSQDYADIVFYFQTAYAIGYLVFGKVVDWIGARLGYSIAVVIWTIAHVAHGGVHSVTQFAMARFGLGIGESGNFPAGVKAVADWFPARERAFAVGLFNAGSNVGAILTPLLIWAMVPAIGWRMTFVVTGIFGLVWLIAWLAIFRDSPRANARVGAAELAHITQDPADPVTKPTGLWTKLLIRKETWAFALGKFFIDPIWWFYLFWLPSYLGTQYHLNLTSWDTPAGALALAAIYLISDIGSVIGGWTSGRFMKMGMSVNKARKLTMLIAACFVLPIMFVTQLDNLWLSVIVIGVAAAAHQAFSATLYTLPSDLVPRYAVGSVIGIGGTVGAIGGMAFTAYIGAVLPPDAGTGASYTPLFIAAGAAYFLALLSIQLLAPKMKRAEIA
jgi:MFS transporter, ACS family, hexuronate transporter